MSVCVCVCVCDRGTLRAQSNILKNWLTEKNTFYFPGLCFFFFFFLRFTFKFTEIKLVPPECIPNVIKETSVKLSDLMEVFYFVKRREVIVSAAGSVSHITRK